MTKYRAIDGGATLSEMGFTLVEIMVVVLIIGILVTMAVPVYTNARLDAEAKSCQASQRTILGAIDVARSCDVSFATASEGQLMAGGSGWYDVLIPGWIRSKPTCSVGQDSYYLSVGGVILGDSGPVQAFKSDHPAR